MFVLSRPAIYALELTAACNNRCRGCSNVYRDARAPASASTREWIGWIESFAGAAVQIRLTGGEPTLHPGFTEILAAALATGAQVTIFTNGRWRDPEGLLDLLAGQAHLAGLLVSLHGADARQHEAFTETPGSFSEALANARLAISRGIPVALSAIITRRNWDQLAAIAALGAGLGAQHVAFNRYLGEADEAIEPEPGQLRAAVAEIERLAAAGKRVKYGIGLPQCFAANGSEGCLAGVAYVAIDPWGRLHPCLHSPSFVGSLRSASLDALWSGPAMAAWRGLMPTECVSCAAYAACHGGCRAVQEVRADRRDPLRGAPLANWQGSAPVRYLPAHGKPVLRGAVRSEAWGYVVLGRGQMLPLRPEAEDLLRNCDGTLTFAALAAQYGEAGLELLGDLRALRLVDIV